MIFEDFDKMNGIQQWFFIEAFGNLIEKYEGYPFPVEIKLTANGEEADLERFFKQMEESFDSMVADETKRRIDNKNIDAAFIEKMNKLCNDFTVAAQEILSQRDSHQWWIEESIREED